MICPNCGAENNNESRVCLKCAGVLQSAVITSEQPRPGIDPAEIFDVSVPVLAKEDLIDPFASAFAFGQVRKPSESDLWPTETVFVPTSESSSGETRSIEEQEPTDLEFEDEEADDLFEQSLSGLERPRNEATDHTHEAVEILEDPEALDDQGPLDLVEPVIANPKAVKMPTAVIAGTPVGRAPEIENAVIPEPKEINDVDVEPRATPANPRRRVVSRIAGLVLFGFMMFTVGLATGLWFLGVPRAKVPDLTDHPVMAERPDRNMPPPGMAFVHGGEFLMGSDSGDRFSRPAHLVSVSPFFIDISEVTNDEYLQFVKATGHAPPAKWKAGTFLDGEGDFPVTGVTWYDAVEYAAWAGKRLPTEAEWEFAARGSDGRMYPWGNEWDPSQANADNDSEGVRKVGFGGRSPFGLADMSGNVWEWTSSDARSYPGGIDIPWSRLRLKVIRGGNWKSNGTTASAVFRGFYGASGEREYNGTGFRCVKDLPRD